MKPEEIMARAIGDTIEDAHISLLRLAARDALTALDSAGYVVVPRETLNPPKHDYWRPGDPECPRDLKAPNGELHTLRCKRCGQDDPRDDRCRP